VSPFSFFFRFRFTGGFQLGSYCERIGTWFALGAADAGSVEVGYGKGGGKAGPAFYEVFVFRATLRRGRGYCGDGLLRMERDPDGTGRVRHCGTVRGYLSPCTSHAFPDFLIHHLDAVVHCYTRVLRITQEEVRHMLSNQMGKGMHFWMGAVIHRQRGKGSAIVGHTMHARIFA